MFGNVLTSAVSKLKRKRINEYYKKRRKYQFGVKTETAPGLFHRSKLIYIMPRFVVFN